MADWRAGSSGGLVLGSRGGWVRTIDRNRLFVGGEDFRSLEIQSHEHLTQDPIPSTIFF